LVEITPDICHGEVVTLGLRGDGSQAASSSL